MKNIFSRNEQDLQQGASRRSFLKSSALLVGAVFGTPSFLRTAFAKPPNILFIICDQMRGDALSCLGHPNVRTPHLDMLAERGVLFENAFSNNPVCVPSRKSIFSSLHPHQHGSMTNRDGDFLPFDASMMDYFQQRGYRIGWAGKNHTFKKQEFRRFDMAGIRAREPFRKYSRFVPPYWHSDTYWPTEQCYPKKNTDAAVEFITGSDSRKPFFLHVSYFDPHPPYMAPSEFSSQYCSSDIKTPEFIEPERLSGRLVEYAKAMRMDKMSKSDVTETMRYYYAAVEWGVDRQVGRLLAAVRDKGIEEETIVIFTADHGDFMGEYNMVRKGMFLYDALLHVPMIWSAPDRIGTGKRVKYPAQGIDIFPTLIELTGGEKQKGLQGVSLLPVLTGEMSKDDRYIFTSAGYNELDFLKLENDLATDEQTPLHTHVLRQNMDPKLRTKSVRNREWKLILNDSRPPELYRMNDEHVERENVVEKSAFLKLRKDLEKLLQEWWPW